MTTVHLAYYSSGEATNLKMGSFYFFFLVLFLVYFFFVCRFCTLDADWLAARWHVLCGRWSRVNYSGQLKNKMSTSDVCFACQAWLYELFVGKLISLTNAYAGCGRPTLNFIERIDLGRSVPTAKPLHLVSVRRFVCTYLYDELFSMNMNLKVFCCLILSYRSFFYSMRHK